MGAMIRRWRSAPSRPAAAPFRARGRPPSAAPRRAPGRCRGGRRQTAGRLPPSMGRCPETATIRAIASSASSIAEMVEIEAVDAPPARRPAAPSASAATGRPRETHRRRPRAAPSGVSGSTSLVKRPKIARALAVDTCCDTMIEARLWNPGSDSLSGTSSDHGANRGKPRVDQAKRLQPFGNIVDRGDPARRCSCSSSLLVT